ncbi:hypothetical protein ACQKGC_18560 [Allorhizobium pseudoryzae]|uniref:hypothetical protein n=1 Tax=Allorhizobium pseudoryzae TaxID=379684 RepID=UPI003CFD1646
MGEQVAATFFRAGGVRRTAEERDITLASATQNSLRMDAPLFKKPAGCGGLCVAEHFVSESGLNKRNFAQIDD